MRLSQMRNSQNERQMKKEERKNQLVPITVQVAGKQLLNVAALEPELRKKIVEYDARLKQSMQKFGASVLEIGQALSEIKMLLEPRRVWTFYLNTIPGFSQATAYRYISSYEGAQANLPKGILDRVLLTGIKMIPTKDKPFGDYTDAVKSIGKPPSDANKADEWLAAVEEKQAELRKKGKKAEVNIKTLQRDAYRSIVQKYAKVNEGQQVQWLRQLFAYVLNDVGLEGPLTISPQEPPEYIRTSKKQEAVS